jgi:hypothetical protein
VTPRSAATTRIRRGFQTSGLLKFSAKVVPGRSPALLVSVKGGQGRIAADGRHDGETGEWHCDFPRTQLSHPSPNPFSRRLAGARRPTRPKSLRVALWKGTAGVWQLSFRFPVICKGT